jgi:threonine dehydrogenase-like Zn-dependent dehydrogenase
MTEVSERTAEKLLGPVHPKAQVHGETMHALVWRGRRNIRLETVAKPGICHPQQALVRITATSLGGSDLSFFENQVEGLESGDILGHEFMGVVERVGESVAHIQVGDRVVVSAVIADGACDYCKRGEYSACKTTNPNKQLEDMYGQRPAGVFGYSHLTGGYPGGLAEYAQVPFADINCLKVPDEIPDTKALFLSDILCTSFWGTEMAAVGQGDIVAIWGMGPVGLLTAQWCLKRGARKVIGIDSIPYRLEFAARHVGIEIVNFKERDVLSELHSLAPSGIDVSIQASGAHYAKTYRHSIEKAFGMEDSPPDTLTEMMKATRMFGRVSILGEYFGTTNDFPIGAMIEKALTVRGGRCPIQRFWPKLLEQLESGEIDPSFVVSHKFALADAPDLFSRLISKDKDNFIKVILRP